MPNPGDEIQTTEEVLLAIIGRELVWKEQAQKKYVAALQAYAMLKSQLEPKQEQPTEEVPAQPE